MSERDESLEPRGAYRIRRSEARAARRAAAAARVAQPIEAPVADPLAAPRASFASRGAGLAGLLFAAFVAHGAVLGGFYGVNTVFGGPRIDKKPEERIELVVVQPEPPPPPVEVPEPEPEAPEAPEPKKPKPKPKPKKKVPPPPDPIDQPPEPKTPPKKKARRIVGLSLGSTTKGGSGPSFSVGNTRMGRTEDKAEDPNAAKPLPRAAAERSNRKASRLPIGLGGKKLKKPKYAGPRLEPAYPSDYRSQGLQAKITVEVKIGKNGRVSSARIVRGSAHKKFEVAALAAAKKQRWVPAKRGDEPIAYTLTYSYQFRVKD